MTLEAKEDFLAIHESIFSERLPNRRHQQSRNYENLQHNIAKIVKGNQSIHNSSYSGKIIAPLLLHTHK